MNILLTSVGRRTYLLNYFKDALGDDGKIFASNSEYTYALSQANDYVLTPLIYSKNYIDFLIDYCQKNHITVLISLFDIDLMVLAKNKQKFAKHGITVIVSDERAIDNCNDKWKTFEFLKSINISTPETYIDFDSAKQAIKDGKIKFPLIIKPRFGMGSIGIYTADNQNELEVFYHKVKNEIANTYLKYESGVDIEHSVLVQTKIIDDDFGLEIINNLNGGYETVIAKRKFAMRAGETDIAEIIDSGPFEATAKKLSQELGHISLLDVDCFYHHGEVMILEMNARFGGMYPFAHLAGVNLPKQLIKWLKGESTDPQLLSAKIGVVGYKDLVPVIIPKEKS